jgi:hypothetical protein
VRLVDPGQAEVKAASVRVDSWALQRHSTARSRPECLCFVPSGLAFSLRAAPASKTSKAGKPYVLATIREGETRGVREGPLAAYFGPPMTIKNGITTRGRYVRVFEAC